MKIWVINPFDNLPVEGYRPQRFWMVASAFAKAGHDVTLWSSDFSHSNKKRRVFTDGEIAKAGKESGCKIILIKTPSYRRNISFKRIYSHMKFAANWLAAARKQKEYPDLIIASSPPLALGKAVRKFTAARMIPYIIDMTDAWPEAFEQVVPSWFLFPLKRLARKNYANAAAITTVSRRFIPIAEASNKIAPVKFFPIGIPPVTPPMPHAREQNIRLLYLGAIGRSYDLETVIEAVKEMPCIKLDIAGTGPEESNLRRLASGAGNITFHGYLQKEKLNELLASSDAGIIPMFDESHVGIPCKLADYLSFGLPVLNSLSGEVAGMLESSGAGFTCTSKDRKSFISALNKLLAADAADLRNNALRLAKQFDASGIYPEYVEFAISAVSKKNKKS